MKTLFARGAQWNWALLDQALVSGTNFLMGVLLVRYLGFEQYGLFVLAWMAVQFVMGVQNALIVSPMMSIAPKLSGTRRSGYYAATLRLQTLLIALAALLVGALSLIPTVYRPQWLAEGATLPLVSCMVFLQLQDFLRRNLFSRLAPQRAFYVDLIAYGAQLPLMLMVVAVYPSFQAALLSIVAAMLVSILVGGRWLPRAEGQALNTRDVAVRHWHSSRWLLGSTLLQWLSDNYFLIIAGVVLGPAAVGAIRGAQNLLALTHIFFLGLENVVPGEASQRFHHDGIPALRGYLVRISLVLLASTGLVAALAAQFSRPLLNLAYGAADPISVEALGWYVPIYLLVALALPLRAGLRTLEQTRAIFFAYVLGTAFALLAARALVTDFGVAGVMFGILVNQVVMMIVLMTSLGLACRSARPALEH
ncbi:hypothetical protein [Stutzerimonas zhaodongensis]|jgi:O-antigen/teichoic acid export membrane protein|uniref:Polysaccharide biosynthesis protein n=1 Tax=Stutzerimonas zhaodongensis TaxID=1176257 RepID=A0A365PWJ8_9GAMM|nr:hypothetical protein [Stutzerimonas zhaodongensis]QWV18815.1 hypothetical protein KQ248_09295 [Stutzerimonas zhaodongensis]RBA59470.1 hypothetical protein DQ403_09385 [Stutzerimonas zhaodongensis]